MKSRIFNESITAMRWIQGRNQNLKQVPQSFMKAFNVDDVVLTS